MRAERATRDRGVHQPLWSALGVRVAHYSWVAAKGVLIQRTCCEEFRDSKRFRRVFVAGLPSPSAKYYHYIQNSGAYSDNYVRDSHARSALRPAPFVDYQPGAEFFRPWDGFTLRAPPRERTVKASAMPSTTLTVATLNVHGWHNESDSSWEGLVHLLQATAPDVVALQEATKHRVPALADALGGLHWLVRHNCALLSRYHLTPIGLGHTGGKARYQSGRFASRKELKHDRRTRHCAARVCLGSEEDPIEVDIVCLHLDHVREPTRLSELAKLVVHLSELTALAPTPHRILTGDFNALTRDDYTAVEWARIADVRARNAWEAPVSEVTAAMTRAPTKAATLGLQMVDACRDFVAANAHGPCTPTSRFDTRIDYVYLSHALAGGGVTAYECHNCMPDISDHNLVLAKCHVPPVMSWSRGGSKVAELEQAVECSAAAEQAVQL